MEGGGVIMEARKLTLYFFLSYCKHSSSHHYYHHHQSHSNHHHRRRKEKIRGNAHSRGPIQSSYSSKKQSPKTSQEAEAEAEDDDEEEEEEEEEDHYHDHDQPESPGQYINSPIDYSNSTHFLNQTEAEAEEEAGGESGEKPKRMIHPSSLIGCFCLRRLRRVSHSSSADHSVLKRGNSEGRATIFDRAEPIVSVSSPDANALASPGRPQRDTAIARRVRGTSSSSSRGGGGSSSGGSVGVVGLAAGGRRSPASRSGRATKWKPGLEIIREDRLAVVGNQAIVPVPVGADQERSRIKKTFAKPSQQQYYSWYSYHRKSISAKASYNKINWLHDGRSPLHSNNPLSFMF